jgi:hypothetical protein
MSEPSPYKVTEESGNVYLHARDLSIVVANEKICNHLGLPIDQSGLSPCSIVEYQTIISGKCVSLSQYIEYNPDRESYQDCITLALSVENPADIESAKKELEDVFKTIFSPPKDITANPPIKP